MTLHYWGIIVLCGVLAMLLGSIWYGPLFGKKWMRITGAEGMDPEKCKEMQRKAVPLYFVQFLLVIFQLFVLSHLTGYTAAVGLTSALWIWGGFVLPTVAACCMWTNEPRKMAWSRFLIQAGYQLVLFVMFGLILGGLM